ncbi:glycoside hydrolase family 88 protein [Tamlana fucoidanivorans]|uniref:Glucuronyl hydrolase n=1 Tax=Allotamlana fucoidanivorans TaxID=2583814 RepID=A0A5C4SP29_9FLAO|nr:glycoside hydrolase family 88 protein [Tamlana fucoidanivorans]TNJ46034.1 glucuronyl hydrolase [Tamlana fucoidanivorans]
MIFKLRTIIFFTLTTTLFFSCNKSRSNSNEGAITNNNEDKIIGIVSNQYDILYDSVENRESKKRYIPRSIENNEIKFVSSHDWTSGFYAGSLWYLYDLTGQNKWKERALKYTLKLDSVKYYTGNHDIGFMMESSFGNAMKFDSSNKFDEVIVQSAKSLLTRFRPQAGIIQSWDSKIHFEEGKWRCPVIIDNMMNLELLFHATELSGDSIYHDVAVSHANKTIENHFRPDNSSYHVVDYDIESGEIISKSTHQGFADNSDWARGQAWGLYGFTVMYRFTKNPIYLDQAIKIAEFIKNHPNLPDDSIPYWDYDVDITESTSRDASAAAITASALLELIKYVQEDNKSNEYLKWAKIILENLSSDSYLARNGSNKGFILMHSAGIVPYGKEIDVPLNYADYYYLEASSRLRKLK